MKKLIHLCLILTCLPLITGPPVQPKEATPDEADDGGVSQLQYQRYLQEVVDILEKDPDFRKKLEDANATHLKTYDFARELQFVNHNVRQQLDEAKRREIKRLKDLFRQKEDVEKENGHTGHLDAAANTFEIEDLQKLILKTTNDLDEIDKKRRDDFKQYEMDKEHKRKEEMKAMNDKEKAEAEQKHKEEQEKHNDHPKLHQPGHKEQLEDVWEKEDELDREDFDPKTFFKKRDLNNDGAWSPDEVEQLFQLELDKLYAQNNTEDDIEERFEEMARMREQVIKEMDTDADDMITEEEFLKYSRSKDFEKDEEWQDIGDKPQYTDEELAEYEKTLDDHEKPVDTGHEDLKVPPPPDQVKEMEKGQG